MNLAQLYSECVAVCPEAEYEGLYPPEEGHEMWVSDGKGYISPAILTAKDAQAIIENHLTKVLLIHRPKMGYFLFKSLDGDYCFAKSSVHRDLSKYLPSIIEAAHARLTEGKI